MSFPMWEMALLEWHVFLVVLVITKGCHSIVIPVGQSWIDRGGAALREQGGSPCSGCL